MRYWCTDGIEIMIIICLKQGGTASSSQHLNDRNLKDRANSWPDYSRCDFIVTLGATDSVPAKG